MVRIKICGLMDPSDAYAAASYGADAVGLVFAPSRRQVSLEIAEKIIKILPPFVSVVGIFVNDNIERVNRLVERLGLDYVQLHGDESPEYCKRVQAKVIKALRVKDGFLKKMSLYSGQVNGFLLDTYIPGVMGGTGKAFDWTTAVEAGKLGPVIIAGGLTPDNVQRALKIANPYGVDVSSGVEFCDNIDKVKRDKVKRDKVKKDKVKMKSFIDNVRRFEYECAAR